MGPAEEQVRGWLDSTFPPSWQQAKGPGPEVIGWVRENGEHLLAVAIAQREAMIGLAKQVDQLRTDLERLKQNG